eukprot:COSAG06_NODE_2364_length_7003_cov_3.258980_1_plen_96_part_00
MFVPSLSWQNDHFIPKSGQKVPFSYLLRWYRAPTLPAKGNIVSIVLGGKGASTAPAAGSSSSNDFTLRSRLDCRGTEKGAEEQKKGPARSAVRSS